MTADFSGNDPRQRPRLFTVHGARTGIDGQVHGIASALASRVDELAHAVVSAIRAEVDFYKSTGVVTNDEFWPAAPKTSVSR